jgi:hypothetical protein
LERENVKSEGTQTVLLRRAALCCASKRSGISVATGLGKEGKVFRHSQDVAGLTGERRDRDSERHQFKMGCFGALRANSSVAISGRNGRILATAFTLHYLRCHFNV